MATQKKSPTKPVAKPKPTEAPEQEVKEYAPVADETIKAAAHCIKNGFHDKLRDIVKSLDDDHPFKIEMLMEADSMDARAKAQAKLKAKKAEAMQINGEAVLDKFNDLHDILAEYELSQRMNKKPFHHAVIARRRLVVMQDSFKRNAR